MTNYLNAKNGIEIWHSDGITQILAGDGDPAVVGQEASIGSIFLRSDNGGGIYTKTDSINTGWTLTASGTGSGGFTPESHTLSGTAHIGILADLQIPTNIVREYQLLTTSGILRYDIDHIDGGPFI